ncbi:MAG TPA: hypothetical protein VID73_01895 [Ktedonobacterales bacterium]|jgi:hypothetical protein
MSAYNIALFIHVSGAMGYLIAAGIRVFGMAALRRARRVEQVRLLSAVDAWVGPLFGISLLLVLIAGLYMAATAWGFATGWIDVTLVSLLLILVTASPLMESRRRAIARLAAAAPDGPIPPALEQRIHDPVLRATVRALPVLLLGIVFLMTTKPPLAGAVVAMVVALAVGLVWGALPPRRIPPTSPQAPTFPDADIAARQSDRPLHA